MLKAAVLYIVISENMEIRSLKKATEIVNWKDFGTVPLLGLGKCSNLL